MAAPVNLRHGDDAPVDETRALPVQTHPAFLSLSASFTRPNDTATYAVNDLIGNSLTASAVTPMVFDVRTCPRGFIRWMAVGRSTTAVDMSFALHLFYTQPFAAGSYPADNAALYSAISRARLLDGTSRLDILIGSAVPRVCADGSVQVQTVNIPYDASETGYMYGLLTAQVAVAMGAQEVLTVKLLASAIS